MNEFSVGDTVKCKYRWQYYDADTVEPFGKIGVVLKELPYTNKFGCIYLITFNDLFSSNGELYTRSYSPYWLELVKPKERIIKIV